MTPSATRAAASGVLSAFGRNAPVLIGVALLIVLFATASVRYADMGFCSLGTVFNLLGGYSFLGIAAIGLTFVVLSGGIDLSVGAVMSLSSIVVASLITNHGWPTPAAFAAALAAGACLGAASGAVIHAASLPPFIVTLAAMFLARGLGFMISLESIPINDPTHRGLAAWGLEVGDGDWLPITAVIFLAVTAVGAYVARFTPFGRAIYTVGGSEEAALLMGMPVGRVKVSVYALSGFCSALAGIVLTLYLSSGSHIEGVGLELDALAAVVIGGTLLTGGVGTILGTLVGVLITGIVVMAITTYEPYGFGSGSTKLAVAGLLLLFVLLQRLLTGRLARA